MNNFVFVAILAVFVYFMLLKSTFEIKAGIFIYQEPKKVYESISSMDTIQRFHPFAVSTKLVRKETSPEGVVTEFHNIEEHIPVMWNWTFPLLFEVKMEFTKPDEALTFSYSIWYGTVIGQVTWAIEPREGHKGPGVYLSSTSRITCPWPTSSFTERRAKESQNDILQRIANVVEYMSKMD
ncbi:uncharacterized protein [Diadema antillarum]|uniref:uncharacterized protein n=1 Tax=Diadema antillarum TaxID=105358 RepID=UPI003A87721D